MDFLNDPRFSQYRNTTTMTKYFPLNMLNQSQLKQNIIYKILKFNQLNHLQKHHLHLQKQYHKQNQRRSTMQTTQQKFLFNKTSQRLKTINSFFQIKKIIHQKIQNKSINHQIEGIKRQIVKLNQFSLAAQQFQKSIKLDKKQIKLLKKYNQIVQDHFNKFKINQDRTRKQIKDHEKIIQLLLNDKTDQNIAYFNVIHDKKSKININSSNKEQPNIKYNSFCQLTNQKVHQYSNSKDCEQKISKAIESYKKMNSVTRSIKRPQTSKSNCLSMHQSLLKNKRQKNNDSFDKLSKSISRNSFCQLNKKQVSNHHNYSNFFKQNKNQLNKQIIKMDLNKENTKNRLNLRQVKNNKSKIWCSFNKQNKIKKTNISKMKNNLFLQSRQQKQTVKQDQLRNEYKYEIIESKQKYNKQRKRSQSIQKQKPSSIQKQKHNLNNNKNRLKTVGSLVGRRSYYGTQKSSLSILS